MKFSANLSDIGLYIRKYHFECDWEFPHMMHLLELQLKIISHVPRVCLYSASSENISFQMLHKAFPISATSHPHSSSINRLNHQKLYLIIFILSNKTCKEIFNLFYLHKVSKEFDNNWLVLKWPKIM